MWMATSGGKGRKAQKKAGAKRGEERRKGWWLKRGSLIRKVRQDQRGLGPRLRVSRRAVGAKARFWAQRVILHYSSTIVMSLTRPSYCLHMLYCLVVDTALTY